MKHIIFTLVCMLSSLSYGAELSAATQQEISHLFSYLENSGCQFNRNDSWYEAKDAVTHINKKYQYLLGKNLISSTESFIEGAATKSSMSGKPYQVRCDGVVAQSAPWFKAELTKYRKTH